MSEAEAHLRAVVQTYADARAARDAAIRDAIRAGMSSRKVGEVVGLSHTRVLEIAHDD